MSKTKTAIVVGNRLKFIIIDSPVGKLLLAGDDNGLQRIQFENNISVDHNWQEDKQYFNQVILQLKEYFAGKREQFNLQLNPIGTEFQKQTWKQLQKIEYGTTKFYAQIAEEMGRPKAARAVGLANNRNPLPIIIPCHRVVGKNGSLTGFAGGLGVKQKLLELEYGNSQNINNN